MAGTALLSVANLHLVHREYDQALDAFRELQQRFPKGARASYAHWKAAWLTLRLGRNEEAKKEFEEQIGMYPTGNETSAALYWRARLAEEDNQPAMARAYYQKLSDRYRNYYYAELGRERLQKLPETATDPPGEYPLLDHIPPLEHGEKVDIVGPARGRSPSAESGVAGQWRVGGFCGARVAGCGQRRRRKLGPGRDGAALHRYRPLRSRHRSDEAFRPQLFCGRYSNLAAGLLGGAISAALLGRPEEIFFVQWTGSLPGGVADPAGIGI